MDIMESELIKSEYVTKYTAVGESKFYKYLLVQAVSKLAVITNDKYKGISPELELLSYSDRFIILYRRDGDEKFLNLSRIFRRVAHRIYRVMLKKSMTTHNSKFLNAV